MATHSSVLAWRIPGTAEPGGLLSLGSHRVGHDWSDLAAAAAGEIFPNQESNPLPLHWQTDSYPLYHQRSHNLGFCYFEMPCLIFAVTLDSLYNWAVWNCSCFPHKNGILYDSRLKISIPIQRDTLLKKCSFTAYYILLCYLFPQFNSYHYFYFIPTSWHDWYFRFYNLRWKLSSPLCLIQSSTYLYFSYPSFMSRCLTK